MTVSEAVLARRSIRAFLPVPVDPARIVDILGRATRAPSGGNLQPWRFFVVAGETMARFRARIDALGVEHPVGEPPEYAVYPPSLGEPYRSRRFEIGEAMYALLGIPREDRAARLQWFRNNDRFFDAPAGAFCFIDRAMGPPQWSDLGMVLQTAMLLFQEAGLDTCPQESWSRWSRAVAEFVAAPPELMLFCGLAIGHADPEAPVNRLVSARAHPDAVITVV